MKGTLSFLYQLLNSKKAHWVIILFATTIKSILTAAFSNFEGDKSFYLLLAKNLGNGEGFTIPVSLLSNPGLTEQVYIPSAVSPLYSVVIAPLLKIFPGNYVFVSWLVESLAWLLLFIILYRILIKLVSSPFWPNLFVLFSGFFLYNIELSSSSKDVLATAILMASLLHCMQISTAGRRTVLYLMGSSFLFLLPGLVKYTYLPLAAMFPFTILFAGIISRQRWLLRSGSITLLFSILLIALHYFYFRSLEVNAMKQHADFFANRWSLVKSGDDFVAGFYPGNLRQLYPFIPASVINLDFVGIQVRSLFPSLYKVYGTVLFVLNVFGILALTLIFIYTSKRNIRKPVSQKTFFFLAGSIISFSILALTIALSLRYKPIEYKASVSSWTYVFENRPFFFSILFIQLLLLVFLFTPKPGSVLIARIRQFILVIMGAGFLHGIYFAAKTTIGLNRYTDKKVSVIQMITAQVDSIQSAQSPQSMQAVWLATEMQHLDWYTKLKGKKVLNHVSFLADSAFRLPPKTILLTAITKEDTMQIRKYTSRPDVELLQNYNNEWFLYIQPHSTSTKAAQ
jgi:hypothetical protein